MVQRICQLTHKVALLVLLERLSIAFTENVNLYHVTKFSLYLSFTVHYNYTKIGRFPPILSIRIVLAVFVCSFLILKISQLESHVAVCRKRDV